MPTSLRDMDFPAQVDLKAEHDLRNLINYKCRSLKLFDALEGAETRIKDAVLAEAAGSSLWVNLIIGIIDHLHSEHDILSAIAKIPVEVEDAIEKVLQAYSFKLSANEAGELNIILAWMTCALRPLSLAEVQDVLSQVSPTRQSSPTLQKRLREDYSTLITLVRDDGIFSGGLSFMDLPLTEMLRPGFFEVIPEATTLVFAHPAVGNHFRMSERKISFDGSKNWPKIGFNIVEAPSTVLVTCLEALVESDTHVDDYHRGTLRHYAIENWYEHLIKTYQAFKQEEKCASVDQERIVCLLFALLNDESVIRRWSRSTTGEFYSMATVNQVMAWLDIIPTQLSRDLARSVYDWMQKCKSNPRKIFDVVAQLHAQEGLLADTWAAVDSLEIIAQIRALVLNDQTLDKLPRPLPVNKIIEAADWIKLDKTVTWYRKLGVCLRNCGHLDEALEAFKTALRLDQSSILSRSGLAILYERNGQCAKAIELELENMQILSQRLENSKGGSEEVRQARKAICESYESIAFNYEQLNDKDSAMKYWYLSVGTGDIEATWALHYIRLLLDSPDDTKWTKIMETLKSCQQRSHPVSGNLLAHCFAQDNLPGGPPSLFFAAAMAAKETEKLAWLEQAYEQAIESATSHLMALVFKCCLAYLYKNYTRQHHLAEPLVEEIINAAILSRNPRIEDLEQCKRIIADDFGIFSVRNFVQAGAHSKTAQEYRDRLRELCNRGVQPLELTEKIRCGDSAGLYLALMDRLAGDTEASMKRLRPYITRCYRLVTDCNNSLRACALIWLVKLFLAIGRVDVACSVFRFTIPWSIWYCVEFHLTIRPGRQAFICRLCFYPCCHQCMHKVEPGYCVASHDFVSVNGTPPVDTGDILFVKAKL